MRALFETTALMGAAQIVALALQLFRGKAIAVLIGPEGAAVVGNTMAFVGFWGNMLLLGLHIALLRFGSESVKNNRLDTVRLLFSTTIRIHLLVSVMGVGVGLAFLSRIGMSLYQTQALSFPLALVLIGLPLQMLQVDIGNLFNAFNLVKAIAAVQVLAALAGLVLVVPLIAWLSLNGAILSLFAQSVVMFLIAVCLYKRHLAPRLGPPCWEFSKPYAVRMLKYGGANQLAILVNSLTAYLLRTMVTSHLLLTGAGLFNAAMSLGSYTLLLQSASSIYYYPKIAALYTDHQAVTAEVNNVVRFYTILLTPILVGVLVLARPLILVVLTDQFLPIQAILVWILTARFFEVLQGVITIPMFIMEKYKVYLGITMLANGALLAATYMFLRHFELLGAALAQAVGYALLLALSYVGARWTYAFKLRPTNLLLVGTALGLLAVSGYMGTLSWLLRVIPIGVVLVWMGVAVRKSEWIGAARYLRAAMTRVAGALKGGSP
jgi:O-antigen/teichoic acid export membrane protein